MRSATFLSSLIALQPGQRTQPRGFVRHGTDPARLAVLGNPRFDALGADLVQPGEREAGIRLLLALSPTALAANQRLLSLVLDALSRLPTGAAHREASSRISRVGVGGRGSRAITCPRARPGQAP